MIEIASNQDSVTAWLELASLADEFYHTPTSIFPFRSLKTEDIWREYGICTKEFCDPIGRYLVKGNFISAYILRDYRLKWKEKYGTKETRPDLSSFLFLPVELILEVFSQVHPVDLFSLIRTTRYLRSLLLSRGSKGVWNSAFFAHDDVPSVPQGISPPKWATMLFGPPKCDFCNVYPALVNFTYQERRCQSCQPEIWETEEVAEALATTAGSPAAAIKLVPGTPHIGALYYPRSHLWDSEYYSLYFRRQDVDRLKAQITMYRLRIEERLPGATEDLNDFLAEQRQRCSILVESAERSSTWAKDGWDTFAGEYVALMYKICERFEGYLKSLGHYQADLQSCSQDIATFIHDHYIFKWHRKEFNKWRKQLEEMVTTAKIIRLKQKVEAFCDLMIPHYAPSGLWRSLPPIANVLTLPSVQHYIVSCSSELEEESKWPGVKTDIDAFVCRWLDNSETPILLALRDSGYDIGESNVRSTLAIASMSVFICNARMGMHRTALTGWDNVSVHLRCLLDKSGACTKPQSSNLVFSDLGHQLVHDLVTSLSMNPSTTTISQLDKLNAIFVCNECGLVPLGRDLGSYFYTWRQAVHHGVIEKPGHISFTSVAPDTRKYILSRHRPKSNTARCIWACHRCDEHYRKPVNLAQVSSHLTKEHGINSPKEGIDYIDWTPPDPVFLSREPSECYRCLLCKSGRNASLPLYPEKALKLHLADKHAQIPIEGKNWEFLEIPPLPRR